MPIKNEYKIIIIIYSRIAKVIWAVNVHNMCFQEMNRSC